MKASNILRYTHRARPNQNRIIKEFIGRQTYTKRGESFGAQAPEVESLERFERSKPFKPLKQLMTFRRTNVYVTPIARRLTFRFDILAHLAQGLRRLVH